MPAISTNNSKVISTNTSYSNTGIPTPPAGWGMKLPTRRSGGSGPGTRTNASGE